MFKVRRLQIKGICLLCSVIQDKLKFTYLLTKITAVYIFNKHNPKMYDSENVILVKSHNVVNHIECLGSVDFYFSQAFARHFHVFCYLQLSFEYAWSSVLTTVVALLARVDRYRVWNPQCSSVLQARHQIHARRRYAMKLDISSQSKHIFFWKVFHDY